MRKQKLKKSAKANELSDQELDSVAGGANIRKPTDKSSISEERFFVHSRGVPFQMDEPDDVTWSEEKTRRKRKTLLKG